MITLKKFTFIIISFFCIAIYSQTETVFIDFGQNNTVLAGSESDNTVWNNVTNKDNGIVYSLINSNNIKTGIKFNISDGFEGISSSGTTTPGTPITYPSSATKDFFYGSTSNPLGTLAFNNLIIGKEYTISFFASRTEVSDNRETKYEIVGSTTQTVLLNAANNTTNATTAITFTPKTDGSAIINISAGANNTNSSKYFYLGAIELSFETDATVYSNNALLIDFGSPNYLSNSPWNNLTDYTTSGKIDNITNYGGNNSGIKLSVTDAFSFYNEEGGIAGLSTGYPNSVTQDSFFGNAAIFETYPINNEGKIKFENFSPSEDLTITIYSSRMDYVDNYNRETKYEISGATTETLYLNANNNTNYSTTTTLKPNANGEILISLVPGSNNTTPEQFFYIGALSIDYTAIPNISLKYPNGGEFWQVGKTPEITWESSSLSSTIDLEYSTDNGNSWTTIATGISNTTNSYNWTIPNNVSTQCKVRVTSNTVSDTSDASFEISSNNLNCNIVVLGSSTAYGTGASPIENSWVNLFKNEVFQKNTQINVINLALGGYTTYQILPTGTTISGVSETIDVDRNITKALSYNPIAIIVNMPSNDTEKGYSPANQMSNYATIKNAAYSASDVPIYFATTQPRNFSTNFTSKTADQITVKNDIISTYGTYSINFWDDISDEDGYILSNLNSGDGVHLNNDGHSLLFAKVSEKNLHELGCNSTSLGINEFLIDESSFKVFPNPTSGNITLNFMSDSIGKLNIEVFDLMGRQLFIKNDFNFNIGNNSIPFNLTNELDVNTQLIYGEFTFKTAKGNAKKRVSIVLK